MSYYLLCRLCVFSDIIPELLFNEDGYISRMNIDGSMYSRTLHTTYFFDIDTVDNMLYYYNLDNAWSASIKRAIIDNITAEFLYTPDQLYVEDIAVDWIGRYVSCSLLSYLYLSMN